MRKFLLWAGWAKPRARDLPGVRRMEPPTHWLRLWDTLCANMIAAGLQPRMMDFYNITWYTCPEIPAKLMNRYLRALNGPVYHSATNFAGIWLQADNSIVFAHGAEHDDTIVRHEMSHAIRQVGGHEPEWFNLAFGNFTGLQPEQL